MALTPWWKAIKPCCYSPRRAGKGQNKNSSLAQRDGTALSRRIKCCI